MLSSMKQTKLIDLFQRSRSTTNNAVIEGVQALKHAARFDAEFAHIITCDIELLTRLLSELAPDISNMILSQAEEVDETVFSRLSPQPPRTKVIALAKRKVYTNQIVEESRPVVFLENPRDLENIGAVIRVSAAANAAAVVASGSVDIWHPAIIRGAAGLHYAVPVLNDSLENISHGRPVLALDPTGEEITEKSVLKNSVLIFGTERHGIAKTTLEKAGRIVRLPMKPGVSSLNLATSVAATLYKM